MAQKLGFAVVGCAGRMGMRRLRTILDNPQARLVCVADLNQERAAQIAREAGCRYCPEFGYVEGDEFMLTYGDAVSDINLGELVEFHRSHGKVGTVTRVRPPSRFGELVVQGERVGEFTEKPQVGQGLINGGFFIFRRRFLITSSRRIAAFWNGSPWKGWPGTGS